MVATFAAAITAAVFLVAADAAASAGERVTAKRCESAHGLWVDINPTTRVATLRAQLTPWPGSGEGPPFLSSLGYSDTRAPYVPSFPIGEWRRRSSAPAAKRCRTVRVPRQQPRFLYSPTHASARTKLLCKPRVKTKVVTVIIRRSGTSMRVAVVQRAVTFSSRRPVVGRVFVGVVQRLSDEARAKLIRADFACSGRVATPSGSRWVKAAVARTPIGAGVPSVVVWSWKIPAGSAGRSFTVNCWGATEELDNGFRKIGLFDGVPMRWTIRPRPRA